MASIAISLPLPLLLLLLSAATASVEEAFLQCFTNTTSLSNTSSLIFTPKTTYYNTIFLSSIRNIRVTSTAARPTAIVTPTTPSHVSAAVSCARSQGLRTRVRSGGHDYEGLSYISYLPDPFILIDLAHLRSITFDDATDTAWVEAGATVGELYYHVSKRSNTSAFPAGVCPTVGIGGQFTGGGIGAMMRKHGVASDNFVDALIVDVNGNIHDRSSMGEDLFWAIRGGGAANFGVVVSLKLQLVSVPTAVTVFTLPKTLRNGATRLVESWQQIGPKLDTNLFIRVQALAGKDNETDARTIIAYFQGLFLGSISDLLPLMKTSFPDLGLEAKDCMEVKWVQSTLYFNGNDIHNESVLLDRKPFSKSSFKAKSDFVKEPISRQGLEEIWEFLMKAEDEPVRMVMDPWGGKLEEIDVSEAAFPHRKGNLYNIQYVMSWREMEEEVSERHLEWMRRLYELMEPYVSKNPRSAYLNYRDLDLGRNVDWGISEMRWAMSYYGANVERLVVVKRLVDPKNYFGNEQSILPFPY